MAGVNEDIAFLAGSVQQQLDHHINRNTTVETRDVERLNNPNHRLDRNWAERVGLTTSHNNPQQRYSNQQIYTPPPPPPQYQQPRPAPPLSYNNIPSEYGHQPQSQSIYNDSEIPNNTLPNASNRYIPMPAGKSPEPYLQEWSPVTPESNNDTMTSAPTAPSFQNTSFLIPKKELDSNSEDSAIDSLRREVSILNDLVESLKRTIRTLNTKVSKSVKMTENLHKTLIPATVIDE